MQDDSQAEKPKKPKAETEVDSRLHDNLTEFGFASRTGLAPTFVSPTNPNKDILSEEFEELTPGARVDDFEIVRTLGKGAFGCVYLVRQLSLGRLAALKVSPNYGNEGRTLAQLEHENIVQVFSETLSPDGKQRMLCMQFVAGPTLEEVVHCMSELPDRSWGGASVLSLIDRLNSEPPPFNPAALRERKQLDQLDSVETVCWIGAQLAEALAYAHEKGVLHRDIKPANILQSQYGRPYLADFNLAIQPLNLNSKRDLFGGTLAYMSPEHLEAFHPLRNGSTELVDERSDIFSLGMVLYEMAAHKLPMPEESSGVSNLERLESVAELRKELPPPIRDLDSVAMRLFDRTVRRCLEPDPNSRFQTATTLAAALNGCREMRQIESNFPRGARLTKSAIQRPFVWLVLLALLPHFPIGSTINIAYNSFRIVGQLSESQRATFNQLVLVYNVLVYPICLFLLVRVVKPVWGIWNDLSEHAWQIDHDRVVQARQAALTWPIWVVIIASLGWFPGGLFFPFALHLLDGPIDPWVFVHFLISCTLSGVIAMTYSFFAIQYLSTRIFYPQLWVTPIDLRRTATTELSPIRKRLNVFQFLAGLTPLIGAVIVINIGPDTSSYDLFRFLLLNLIFLAVAGFQIGHTGGAMILKTLDALTNSSGEGVSVSAKSGN